jgi:poly(hydroxyalkanoate) depolymerase family esterase
VKLFNAGAPRSATDAARLSAANALVQRTLAQHGLLAPDNQPGPMALPPRYAFDGMLRRFRGAQNAPASYPADLAEGEGFRSDTFTCPSGTRAFRTYVPASAATEATGVVVMLHGCTQTPEDFAAGTGMNAVAEKHGFIAVYPSQSRGDNAQSCWNWFNRGDQRRGRGEPAILAGMTAQICAEHGVPRDNTFVAGLSAGAAMAVILGETYGDVFAAVGAHSGLPSGAAKDVSSAFAAMAGNALTTPTLPPSDDRVRTIIFHGSGDGTVHPSNGVAIAQRARRINAPQSIETSTTGEAAGRGYTREISSAPDGANVVELWTVDGQGHAWSGGKPAGSYTDPKGPDASAEMIRFFFERSDEDL